MKASRAIKGFTLGLALLLASSALAGNKGSLQVTSPVDVGGKQLAAGEYSVQWEGNGPDVQLNIMKGKKVVTTVPAKMVELEKSPSLDSAVVQSNSDGGRTLSQIRFSGKKYALQIGESSEGGSNSGSGVR